MEFLIVLQLLVEVVGEIKKVLAQAAQVAVADIHQVYKVVPQEHGMEVQVEHRLQVVLEVVMEMVY